MKNQNEFQAELQTELDAENRDIKEQEESGAAQWSKIMEMMEVIKGQCEDLQDQLKDFNKSL